MLTRAALACPALLLAALLSQGCSTCDRETVDRAVAFIDSHQSCQTDADCVVISDYCEELPGGYCGQLAMNREGAESAEWRSLSEKLADCAQDQCTVCLAALVPACAENVCSKR